MFNNRIPTNTALVITSLACIPVIYGLPLLFIGLNDINMVRHFDHGESEIALGWLEAYKSGPLFSGPVQVYMSYPRLFYNIAGLILYPYAFLSDIDYKTVIITWRTLNIIFASLTLVIFYILIKEIFRSRLLAYTASILLGSMPQFLFWSVNVRPNPLEQSLVFLSLFLGLKLIDNPCSKLFLSATIISALAFATKFGSIPLLVLIPSITMVCLWISRDNRDHFTKTIQSYANIFQKLFPILTFVGIILVILIFSQLIKHNFEAHILLHAWTAPGVNTSQHQRLLEILTEWHSLVQVIVWGGAAASLGLVGVSLLLWREFTRVQTLDQIEPSVKLFTLMTISLYSTTFLIYSLVFFLVSPAFIANPSSFLSHFGFQFRYTALGASYGIGGAEPSIIEFIISLTKALHWGWLVIIPFVIIGLILNHKHQENIPNYKTKQLYIYSFIVISIILLFNTYAAIRHIIPVIGLIYALSLIPFLTSINKRKSSWTITANGLLGAGACLVIALNIIYSYQDWQDSRDKPLDIGVHVGAWLSQNYAKETKILKDVWYFYIPPVFTDVENTQFIEHTLVGEPKNAKTLAVKQYLDSYNPDIIITTRSDVHTLVVNLEEITPENYDLVATFTSDLRRDLYSKVNIFQKETIE